MIREKRRGGKSGGKSVVIYWEEGRETREDALLREDGHHGALRGCKWGRMKEKQGHSLMQANPSSMGAPTASFLGAILDDEPLRYNKL